MSSKVGTIVAIIFIAIRVISYLVNKGLLKPPQDANKTKDFKDINGEIPPIFEEPILETQPQYKTPVYNTTNNKVNNTDEDYYKERSGEKITATEVINTKPQVSKWDLRDAIIKAEILRRPNY